MLEDVDLSRVVAGLTALSLEGIYDVQGGDGLALGVLGICDSVADDAFEEGLEYTSSLLVDH